MDFDGIVLVNFGGPRNLHEVESFLKELLCDQDVVRTNFPQLIHKLLFRQIAKKRSVRVKEDYEGIGGKSPIYEDTERLKRHLESVYKLPVMTFHRYLPALHKEFLEIINKSKLNNLLVFPLFPQFSFATTGSCARFFESNICARVLETMSWIPSYETHPAFIQAYKKNIERLLEEKGLKEEDVCLLYSCHGVPRKFICFQDPYEKQCERSMKALKVFFPKADHMLAYQSKFGKGLWLKPYTSDLVEEISWLKKKIVLFIPLSFTSDHIETLFEIEEQYLKPLSEKGIEAYRVNAIHEDFSWVEDLLSNSSTYVSNAMLVRRDQKACCELDHDCCRCKKPLKENLLKSHEEQNSGCGACRECHNP